MLARLDRVQEVDMTAAFFTGLVVAGGLFFAVGAQSAFLISQGMRREHHLLAALICGAFDAVLIALGVAGVGAIVASQPQLTRLAELGGGVYLAGFAALCAWRALAGRAVGPGSSAALRGRRSVVLRTFAVTALNPHVYLDTIVLLGSMSAAWPGWGGPAFGLGAVLASTTWVFGLALGGQVLAPWLARAAVWRVLDAVMALVMGALAVSFLAP